MTTEELKEQLVAEFDKQFGVRPANEEDYCSEGRTAGCDDCETNKQEREEHRDFLLLALTKMEEHVGREVAERIKEEIRMRLKLDPLAIINNSRGIGWDDCYDAVIGIIDNSTVTSSNTQDLSANKTDV